MRRAPGFPCALCFWGDELHQPGREALREGGGVFEVARHCERKRSNPVFLRAGLLRRLRSLAQTLRVCRRQRRAGCLKTERERRTGALRFWRCKSNGHYEFLVNGRFHDPMRIRLPAEKRLHDRELADFREAAAKTAAFAEREAPFHTIGASPAK